MAKKEEQARIGGDLSFSGEVYVRKRSYLSTHHLWTAKHFSDLAGTIETTCTDYASCYKEHRAYVMNSILSSVAFMEAAINELYQDVADNYGKNIDPLASNVKALMTAYWDITEEGKQRFLKILDKYEVVLRFVKNEKFNKGVSPYQDAKLAIDLRNELIHYKPKSLGASDVHDLSTKLRGKFAVNPLVGEGNPQFPDKLLGHGAAAWAVKSCKAFADKFFAEIGVKANYQEVGL